jgi:hypothetical protein
MPSASDDDGHGLCASGTDYSADRIAFDDENSRTYYFGASTITPGKIKEIVTKGYFIDGEAWAPGAEAVLEPDNDVVVMYGDFFVTGLCKPSHPALGDIPLHFQARLHQLTPNAIAQLSKYFWSIGSFGGMPSSGVFVKRYKLHYQLKIVETPEGKMFAQFNVFERMFCKDILAHLKHHTFHEMSFVL